MNQNHLHHLLALCEGFTVEFKRSSTSNLGREICVFANATGGVCLVGVSDGGEVVGLKPGNEKSADGSGPGGRSNRWRDHV